jgi:hypothetical protein
VVTVPSVASGSETEVRFPCASVVYLFHGLTGFDGLFARLSDPRICGTPPSHKLPKLISPAMPATYPAHASPPALRGV